MGSITVTIYPRCHRPHCHRLKNKINKQPKKKKHLKRMKAEKGSLNLAFRLSFRSKNGTNPIEKVKKKPKCRGKCIVFW